MNYKYADITDLIIKSYYKVYNTLGHGFLEKVYERSMLIELETLGLSVKAQYPVPVYYEEQLVGQYIADLIVEDKVIVELKAADCIHEDHEAQLTNYLRATYIEVGLLFNFGKTAQFKRKIFDNHIKKSLTLTPNKSV